MAIRTRAVALGHFYCGETFITVPIDESFVVTLRKVHISGLLWDQKKLMSSSWSLSRRTRRHSRSMSTGGPS